MASNGSDRVSLISVLWEALGGVLGKKEKVPDYGEAADKVAQIWSGHDDTVLSFQKSKARVRRLWPTLAEALDDLIGSETEKVSDSRREERELEETILGEEEGGSRR